LVCCGQIIPTNKYLAHPWSDNLQDNSGQMQYSLTMLLIPLLLHIIPVQGEMMLRSPPTNQNDCVKINVRIGEVASQHLPMGRTARKGRECRAAKNCSTSL